MWMYFLDSWKDKNKKNVLQLNEKKKEVLVFARDRLS